MRPLNLKDLFKAFVAFMVFPISSLLILCIQGLNYNDILPALNVIKASATAPSMIWFHKFIGLYPSKRMLLQGINPSLILILVFVISYLGFKYTEQRKNLRIILTLIILGIVLWNMYFLPRLFCFLPMIFVVLFLINIKEIFKDKALLVLCLLCAGASLKTFFFSDLMVYGFYTVPLLVLGLSLMFIKAFRLPKFLNAGFKLKEHYAIYILMLFVVIFYISHLNIRIQIGNDKLYGLNDNMTGLKGFNKPVNEMVTYLKDNTNINDRVVVYPEGEIINFLSGRKPDYMYYSLHSIFIDTFGKENIIERFKKERFEYVIIVKGFSMPYFGTETSYDELNNFVENNYKLVYVTQSSRKTDGLYLYKLNM